jgi:hypothetical protein
VNGINDTNSNNDVFPAPVREIICAFDYGFVGSIAISPNTGNLGRGRPGRRYNMTSLI